MVLKPFYNVLWSLLSLDLLATASDQFDSIRAAIKTYEKEALEISSPRAQEKGAPSGLSREQLARLVGLLWKLSSAYKDYTRLLEKSLIDIRQNMGKGGAEKGEEEKTLERAAMNLDQLIDVLQKIEEETKAFRE